MFFHDSLNASPTDPNDTLMVGLGYVERDLRRQLFLEQSQTLQHGPIRASDVNEEVVVIECFEFDFGVCGLHNLVDLAVFFAADEFPVFI